VALPPDLPVVDHHCHLSPGGEGVAAARRFERFGGTHLFLTTQSYTPRTPRTVEEYRVQFETTEQLAQQIRGATQVEVFLVVAPYPIDLLAASEELGSSAALDVYREALELAGHWVRERRAVAIGEVGRAHFPIDESSVALLEEGFSHAFSVAREVGCPVVVHSGDLDAAGYRDLAEKARSAGVSPERVVKHFARSRVPPTERGGVVPSYLARRELVRQVAGDPEPWFLETDFLDDPARPGSVLDLATVPRRAIAIAERTPNGPERLRVPFVRSVERVYGLRLEAPDRSRP
jgi:TatD-related deoxyribonuclease